MTESLDNRNTHTCKIAVVGAGHAGIEAALASARMGVDTVLFTMSFESIANLPCNPSIGGTAKGHLVYEIDALGGEMGRAADLVTLQSRTLNRGKGVAVQSKRIQADRKKYQSIMKRTLEATPNLRLIQAEITAINVFRNSIKCENDRDYGTKYVSSVTTRLGEIWECECVIIATGTYLESEIFVGDVSYEAGPDGFLPSKGLASSLEEAGVRLLRFKTGTPARIKRESIDFSLLEEQPGEMPIQPYSACHGETFFENLVQIPCHIVYTNAETHRIIRENIARSAMYSGKIHGTGPRYCPSIEDKLVRFAEKERHQLFIEPMGADTSEIYLQGFSTSLPTDVQIAMLRSLKGFSRAEIMRYAYAIEYNCADPLQMDATLEFKHVKGLFGAGQFNGTSGYEEAAAQGLLAGINAARKVKSLPSIILPRSGSYIGTLIDDLVTKGTNEPYRMMTSRSEYRLLLRQDNADLRLTEIGYEAGLVSEERYQAYLNKKTAQEREKERLEATFVSPVAANPVLAEAGEAPLKSGASLAELLRRPLITYEILSRIDPERPKLSRASILTVEADIKYAGYANRQLSEVQHRKKLEERALPADVDYKNVRGLRLEAAQKLSAVRPLTIGQASRISGVNPADITVLLIYLGLK
ncbi:MAG: tRNA uridine-5-carboxymethylaminomethyl(34) synthesis enzyme MnmG [Clostridia bacterium]|nr:tRNA uridine-5-carboxymethylaminomethyl(34) synthesis enzyme MnmG [Clostridia bacterium]